MDELVDGAMALVVGGFDLGQWCGAFGWAAVKEAERVSVFGFPILQSLFVEFVQVSDVVKSAHAKRRRVSRGGVGF